MIYNSVKVFGKDVQGKCTDYHRSDHDFHLQFDFLYPTTILQFIGD